MLNVFCSMYPHDLYLFLKLFFFVFVVCVASPPKGPVSEQETNCVLGSSSSSIGSEEQHRDSISPHSADSPMSISSPQQHSSASSVSSLSGSDNVRKLADCVFVFFSDKNATFEQTPCSSFFSLYCDLPGL